MAHKLDIKVALKLKANTSDSSKIELMDQNVVSLFGTKYSFNYIFGNSETPYQIYESLRHDYLDNVMNGQDSAVVVYGPDSPCKTETLGSLFFSDKNFNQRGIIPHFVIDLYTRINEEKVLDEQTDYNIFLSLTEIYDGQAFNLLDSNIDSLVKVGSLCNAIKILEQSSPQHLDSHLILKIRVEKLFSEKKIFSADVHFIDLAVSKDNSKYCSENGKGQSDLELLEYFLLLAKLDKELPKPNGELCSYFNNIFQKNTKMLFLVCLDPTKPCINSVTLGSRLYMKSISLDTKFINCQKRKSFMNEETIEWEENSLNEEKEMTRTDFENVQGSSESLMSIISQKTPFSTVKANRVCDSLELYYQGKEKHFKQPELTVVKLPLSDTNSDFYEPKRKKRKCLINPDQNYENIKNMLSSFLDDGIKLFTNYKTRIHDL